MNTEQLEAEQEYINRKNSEFRANLNPEQQEKYRATDEALQILSKAKVECYLFAYLPHYQTNGEEQMIQYNNFLEVAEKVNGEPVPSFIERLQKLHESLIISFVDLMFYILKVKGKPVASFLEIFNIVGYVWNSNLERIKEFRKNK